MRAGGRCTTFGGSGTVVTGGRLMRSVGADGVRAATIQGGESRSVVVGTFSSFQPVRPTGIRRFRNR